MNTIHSYSELQMINPLFTPKKEIKLRLKELTEIENDNYTNQINKELNSCGCEYGKYAVIVVIIGMVSYPYFYNVEFKLSFWTIILFLIGAAVLGKLIGLTISRLRIFKIKTKIKHRTRYL